MFLSLSWNVAGMHSLDFCCARLLVSYLVSSGMSQFCVSSFLCVILELNWWYVSQPYPGGIYFHSQPIPFGHQSLFGLPIVLYHCSHGTASVSLPHYALHLGTPAQLFHVTYCASCI